MHRDIFFKTDELFSYQSNFIFAYIILFIFSSSTWIMWDINFIFRIWNFMGLIAISCRLGSVPTDVIEWLSGTAHNFIFSLCIPRSTSPSPFAVRCAVRGLGHVLRWTGKEDVIRWTGEEACDGSSRLAHNITFSLCVQRSISPSPCAVLSTVRGVGRVLR